MYRSFVTELLEDAPNEPLVREIEHSILKLAGFATTSVSSLPGFAAVVMPSLRPDTSPDVLSALLSALFGWNLKKKLIDMMCSWISEPLGEDTDVQPDDDQPTATESAFFGLTLLNIILKDDHLRNQLLSDSNLVTSIIAALHPYMNVTESRLRSASDCDESKLPDSLILQSVELYYRSLVHIAAISDETVFLHFAHS